MMCHVGKVDWFSPVLRYGFIQPAAGGKEVFVHISAVEKSGLTSLNPGQRVAYQLETSRGKTAAVNIRLK
jgi:CspA family cold shock protein